MQNIFRWFLVSILVLPVYPALAQAEPAASVIVAPASTQPTQIEVVVQTVAATQPAAESHRKTLSDIDLIKALRGEKELTPEQLLQLGYWVQFVRDFVFGLLAFIPKLIVALFLFFVFWLIYRAVRRVVMGGMNRVGMDQSIREMFASLLKWGILGFGLVIAGNQVGIQIAALLTGVSLIGLAIGFAAQESLQNFIAGVVIFWDRPFKIGDWVEIDSTFGQIQRVTFRSTRMLTLDGEVVCFPNTHMLNNRLSNHSTNPINRVNIPIGIAYKESIDRARQVLLGLCLDDARLVPSPAPEVVVNECADSSVNLLLRFWISDESIERRIGYEYLEKAKKALDEAGIEIPFPHLQMFLEKTPAVEALAGKKPPVA